MYSNPSFIGVRIDEYENEYISLIDMQVLQIPLMVRGSLQISDLIENNYMGMEFGVVTTTWIKYKLEEVSSIKIRDAGGNIVAEDIYRDKGSLINGFGSKYNFKIVWGMYAYVNRFFIGARWDMISLSNMYSGRLKSTWKVPEEYSLYEFSAKQGRMKNSYVQLIFAFRLTKK
ncbi:MAG: hypothetical protein K2X86_08790 [Cytophagaceae bacterium]|nr:hypothetical protein [Cytophagaceae bacterium]